MNALLNFNLKKFWRASLTCFNTTKGVNRSSTFLQQWPGREGLISVATLTFFSLDKGDQRSVRNNFMKFFLWSLFLNRQQLFVILVVINRHSGSKIKFRLLKRKLWKWIHKMYLLKITLVSCLRRSAVHTVRNSNSSLWRANSLCV